MPAIRQQPARQPLEESSDPARDRCTGILQSLQRGSIGEAVTKFAALPDDLPAKYILWGLVLAAGGKVDRAHAILKGVPLKFVERFVAEYHGDIDSPSAQLLGEIHLGAAPVPAGISPGVAIFSFPKSGSTFLEAILQAYTGMARRSMSSINDSAGINPDARFLEAAIGAREIARGHLSANARCLTRCVLYDLRPVFVSRNIFESLLSYAEHFTGKYYPYPFEVPAGPVAIDVASFHMAFHYVEMFASWSHFARTSDRVLTLTYEENRRDWTAAAARVLAHSGIAVEADRLARAVEETEKLIEIDPTRVRYALGGSRDQNVIGASMKTKIRSLYQIFPGVDFSPIDPDC